MKTVTLRKFPTFFSFTCGIFLCCAAVAQQRQGNAYAVTADTIGGLNWNVLRLIDMNDGAAVNRLGKAPAAAPGVQTAKNHAGKVAACAFDNTTHRLFFATMHTNELYAVNLNSNNAAPIKVADLRVNDPFISHPEENNISRMVIGADGNGYALTNDAEHFFVFATTGQQVQFRDLGSLKDAATNGQNSIHSFCTGWGGDLVADKYGYLYLVNLYNRVFKIDVNSLEATYTGIIQGLPQGFYTNGAAVDDNGQVVLSCSTYKQGYFLLDMSSLKATAIPNKRNDVFNASDLASANLLFQDKKDITPIAITPGSMGADSSNINIWPNPVPLAGNTFNVAFNALDKGDYIIQLVDMDGKVVVSKAVRVGSKRQTIAVNYGAGISGGLYVVQVLNRNNVTQTARKLFIL
ncbi:T9SS type A sorting domain-containing protein [Chitinophaga japonensis]|uniref:Putative secreted protein (Por secretion system target) n=1 Tax=Chitinophaga japonensis TaxID=104662 RepID=A0A562TGM2_CHIJA|nr:T9SS type A sorting domain-containing protein [Chitinophaga japonensis]TWI92338.1 putative secreted protein (Por secretion system target) [Chitinophaga japonensis]